MKNAIFTVSISNSVNSKMYQCSLKTIKSYAKKIGADLVVLNRKTIKHPKYTPHLEKFNIKNLLERYNRVLYLDNDIIVTKEAPDIFKKYNDPNCVYMFNQANVKDCNHKFRRLKKRLNNNLDFWYKTGDRLFYFNTGVILVSRPNKNYFSLDKNYFDFEFEQGYLNYKLIKKK